MSHLGRIEAGLVTKPKAKFTHSRHTIADALKNRHISYTTASVMLATDGVITPAMVAQSGYVWVPDNTGNPAGSVAFGPVIRLKSHTLSQHPCVHSKRSYPLGSSAFDVKSNHHQVHLQGVVIHVSPIRSRGVSSKCW